MNLFDQPRFDYSTQDKLIEINKKLVSLEELVEILFLPEHERTIALKEKRERDLKASKLASEILSLQLAILKEK